MHTWDFDNLSYVNLTSKAEENIIGKIIVFPKSY